MPCADDQVEQNQSLSDEIVSARAADLCKAAEEAHRALAGSATPPVYVIGTEVPIPGGEQLGCQAPKVTRTKDLARTLHVAKAAFQARGLEAAWQRAVAVVVQPGVEFGDTSVFSYDPREARQLSRFATRNWTGVYEAHSTDYQTSSALGQMVKDHFAILKVGPWLTFAFREAAFGLEAIEREWLSARGNVTLSRVQQTLEEAMVENPAHWSSYYHGDEAALQFARKYSYSDRARYYWPQPAVSAALKKLIANLTAHPAPVSVLSQFLPRQAEAVRAGMLANLPTELIRHKILEVIDQYAGACGARS
jgi:D-tagatose-1,6-bisphosphate aldolase subunit GatZ/KbaZ